MTGITAQRIPSQPAKSKAETKAEITNRTARAIIEAETDRREAKTQELRRARLENEAKEAAAPPAAKLPRRRSSSTGRRLQGKGAT